MIRDGLEPVMTAIGALEGRSRPLDHSDVQRSSAGGDRKQTVDVRVSARTVAGVHRMLGEDGQAVFRGFGIQPVEGSLEISIDRKRALLAGLVFDAGDHSASIVDKVDTFHVIDGRQLLEVVFEGRAGFYDRRHFGILMCRAGAANSFAGHCEAPAKREGDEKPSEHAISLMLSLPPKARFAVLSRICS